MLISQLLRPFGYLAIRHPYKWQVDWMYPGILAIATFSLITTFSDVKQQAAMISLALSFIQSLPGFYIAALAAIATFGRSDIDTILPEPTPKIKIRFRNTQNMVALTRRRFLAMLFAFLTAESIALILYSIFMISYAEPISLFKHQEILIGKWAASSFLFLYLLLTYQMIVATFWGLYYLGYKLHE